MARFNPHPGTALAIDPGDLLERSTLDTRKMGIPRIAK
jgi:hypothetical protein